MKSNAFVVLDRAKRDAVHGGDLLRVRHDGALGPRPHHDRRDQIAGTGRIIVEQAEHGVGPEIEAELLAQFAQRRLDLGLAGVAAPARQRPLRAMGAQARGAAGQQNGGFVRPVGRGECDGDGRAFQLGRGFAGSVRA